MMSKSIYLISPTEFDHDADSIACGSYLTLLKIFKNHGPAYLASDPSSASWLLAPVRGQHLGATYGLIRRHLLFKRHAQRLFIYATDDLSFPFIRGLYCGTDELYVRLNLARTAAYFAPWLINHDFTSKEARGEERAVFASFIGSFASNSIRARLPNLEFGEHVVIEDADAGSLWWTASAEEQKIKKQAYRAVMLQSRYALCPAGVAPLSVRIFEALAAGCVPVVIGDRIALPFSEILLPHVVRVRSRDINTLPSILRVHFKKSYRTPALYRQLYDDYFSPQKTPERLLQQLDDLGRTNTLFGSRSFAIMHYLFRKECLRRFGKALISYGL